MRRKLNKGFTLAELLIVVAIIGVLVAISIPIFTNQLRKAKLATNQSNARAAYAEVSAELLLNTSKSKGTGTYVVSKAKLDGSKLASSYTSQGQKTAIANWSVGTSINGKKVGDAVAKKWTVSIDKAGNVSFGASYN